MAVPYKAGLYRYKQYLSRIKVAYQQPVAKTSLALILSLLTVSFFGLFAIKPTSTAIAKLIKELKESQKINQTLEKKVNNLTQAQFAFTTLQSDLIFVDRALPKKAEFNRLAGKINFLSFNHNLILSSFSFGEFEMLSSVNEATPIKIRLSVAGGFEDIKNFLKDLENLDRSIEIEAVSFSTKTDVAKAQVQADISLNAFWFSNLNGANNEKEKALK